MIVFSANTQIVSGELLVNSSLHYKASSKLTWSTYCDSVFSRQTGVVVVHAFNPSIWTEGAG